MRTTLSRAPSHPVSPQGPATLSPRHDLLHVTLSNCLSISDFLPEHTTDVIYLKTDLTLSFQLQALQLYIPPQTGSSVKAYHLQAYLAKT